LAAVPQGRTAPKGACRLDGWAALLCDEDVDAQSESHIWRERGNPRSRGNFTLGETFE
jgi:hypothetical protein